MFKLQQTLEKTKKHDKNNTLAIGNGIVAEVELVIFSFDIEVMFTTIDPWDIFSYQDIFGTCQLRTLHHDPAQLVWLG